MFLFFRAQQELQLNQISGHFVIKLNGGTPEFRYRYLTYTDNNLKLDALWGDSYSDTLCNSATSSRTLHIRQ